MEVAPLCTQKLFISVLDWTGSDKTGPSRAKQNKNILKTLPSTHHLMGLSKNCCMFNENFACYCKKCKQGGFMRPGKSEDLVDLGGGRPLGRVSGL